MREEPRLYIWAIGIVLAVCLAGAASVELRFNFGETPHSRLRSAILSSSRQAAIPGILRQSRRSSRPGSVSARPRLKSELGRVTLRSSRLQMAPSEVTSVALPESTRPATPVFSEPQQKTLEPLGYAVKANGQVEAIVSDSGYVHVVHVGDTLNDQFKVTKISSDEVELVAATSGPTPQIDSPAAGLPSMATDSQMEGPITPVTEAQERPNRLSAKALGYVEKSDGTQISVLAEGDSVRLVQDRKTLADVAEPGVAAPEAESAKNSKPAPSQQVANAIAPMGQIAPDKKGREPQSSRSALPTLSVARALLSTGSSKPDAPLPQVSPNSSPEATTRQFAPDFAIPPRTKTLGYVEQTNGKVEAILDLPEGVRLVLTNQNPFDPAPVSDDTLASNGLGNYPSFFRRRETLLADFRPRYSNVSRAFEANTWNSRFSSGSRGKIWWAVESSRFGLRDDLALLDRPPPEFEPPGDWDNPNPIAPQSAADSGIDSNPDAQAKGPPPQNSILKTLGYVERQDGQIFAFVETREGEVRLAGKGEALNHQFKVVKVYQDAIELAKLPHASSATFASLSAMVNRKPGVPALAALDLALRGRRATCPNPGWFWATSGVGSSAPAPPAAAGVSQTGRRPTSRTASSSCKAHFANWQ